MKKLLALLWLPLFCLVIYSCKKKNEPVPAANPSSPMAPNKWDSLTYSMARTRNWTGKHTYINPILDTIYYFSDTAGAVTVITDTTITIALPGLAGVVFSLTNANSAQLSFIVPSYSITYYSGFTFITGSGTLYYNTFDSSIQVNYYPGDGGGDVSEHYTYKTL